MANRVHSSPGVYTSEKDLTYNVETIGVTTLGAIGETVKGPAFQPIPISSYEQFSTVFGGVSPEKFKNTQIVKYELSYIAKSYLSQSNQMYVTRILGLSGYDAGDAFVIKTIGEVNPTTIVSGGTQTTINFTGTTTGSLKVSGTTTSLITQIQSTLTNITASKYQTAINNYFTPYNIATGGTGNFWTHDVLYYGNVASGVIGAYVSTATSPGNGSTYSNTTPISTDAYGLYPSGTVNDETYFINNEYVYNGTSAYNGYGFILTTTNVTKVAGKVSGKVKITPINFTASPYTDYHNKTVATLFGYGSYFGSDTLTMLVSGSTVGYKSDIQATTTNPYASFTITGKTSVTGHATFSYNVSLDSNQNNYIKKVLGTSNGAKNTNLYVDEMYDSTLAKGWLNGYIGGLSTTLLRVPKGANGFNHYKFQYQSPATPYFVSELNGGIANKLFRVISISDGNHANTEIKISIANVDLSKKTFDLYVRSFGDTDKTPIVLERYTNANMDPNSPTYIGRLVGTLDNAFVSRSAYILIDPFDGAAIDSVPAGFEGYEARNYTGVNVPLLSYKTKYYNVGEVWETNPSGTPLISSGDKVKKVFLGFSDADYGYDTDITAFKGKQNAGSDTWNSGNDWGTTKGFHMDMNADETLFVVGAGQFTDALLLATDLTQTYNNINTRKFTALMYGGFDGWDVYRDYRTNGDNYKYGHTGYVSGNFLSTSYILPTYDEAFGNSDYYAYLYGYITMQNPEEVSVNILVTPGIDVINNTQLISEVVTIVEEKRLDSIYLPTVPDIKMINNNSPADTNNWFYPADIADQVDGLGLDTNYTAIYYPFIQITDTENSVYVWIPPTAEIVRNLAYTDNVAFPWYATAGYNRGIVKANRTRMVLSQSDRDILYPARINPIATFSDVGTVIFGNRNLQATDTALSELNVRRLLLQARKLIIAVSNRLLFDPNDATIRTQFVSLVNPILDNIRKERGLSDFRIKLEPVSDIDRTTMKGKIFIKPIDALEFIELEFNVTPNSVSFANI